MTREKLNSTPLISVALPVYNCEMFVGDAIRSILAQTFTDLELLILDDGSTDRSWDICQTFAKEDSRIRHFRNFKNLGLAKTMNRLIGSAKGKYVAVQEQDDISVPERFFWQTEILESNPKVGAVSGVAEWIDDCGNSFRLFPGMLVQEKQYPSNPEAMVKLLLLDGNKFVNAASMWRRSYLSQWTGPFDETAKMAVDWQFCIDFAHFYQFRGISKTLVKMRRGQNHVSQMKNKHLLFSECRRCLTLVYRKYRKKSFSPINFNLYRKAMAAQHVLEGRYYGGPKGCHKLLKALCYDPCNNSAWKSFGDFFLPIY